MSKRVFGIDLGTTHCAVAVHDGEGPAQVVPLAQIAAPGERIVDDKLPSFVYAPAAGEGGFELPFDADPQAVVGRYAQQRGAETPLRVISSSKSWLGHAGVDRTAAILPPGAPEDVTKRSPIEVATLLLSHMVHAARAHDDSYVLADAPVVVTVPASFDAVARSLTERALGKAGLGDHVTLLEEPQAALYAWLGDHEGTWRDELTVDETVLVVDIGGGTCDFSLIRAVDDDGALGLERVAVGDHILLGGDNMDLALAVRAKLALEQQGTTLDDRQLRALIHGCRQAKERLLSDESLAEVPVVIPGRGRKLIGGTLRATVTRADVTEGVVQAFLPDVPLEAEVMTQAAGLTTLGLPYARDAAITRHLAAFLRRSVHEDDLPSVVLFNGGVTKAAGVRDRICAQLNRWRQNRGQAPVRVLDDGDPDLAVARGAAYFAQVQQGEGVRIKSGTARSYYVGIERNELAIPGMPPALDAVCIAPVGMTAGDTTALSQPLGLMVGQPAAFRFFSSSERNEDAPGDKVAPAPPLVELPPVRTTLDNAGGELSGVVPVTLEAVYTELGTLELYCRQQGADRRWKLSFDVRGHEA